MSSSGGMLAPRVCRPAAWALPPRWAGAFERLRLISRMLCVYLCCPSSLPRRGRLPALACLQFSAPLFLGFLPRSGLKEKVQEISGGQGSRFRTHPGRVPSRGREAVLGKMLAHPLCAIYPGDWNKSADLCVGRYHPSPGLCRLPRSHALSTPLPQPPAPPPTSCLCEFCGASDLQ